MRRMKSHMAEAHPVRPAHCGPVRHANRVSTPQNAPDCHNGRAARCRTLIDRGDRRINTEVMEPKINVRRLNFAPRRLFFFKCNGHLSRVDVAGETMECLIHQRLAQHPRQ